MAKKTKSIPYLTPTKPSAQKKLANAPKVKLGSNIPNGGAVAGAVKQAQNGGLTGAAGQAYQAASTPAAGATPGVRVDPHLTGDQQLQDSGYWGDIQNQAAAARQRLLEQQRQTSYGITDAKENQVKSTRSTNWAMAARNIFQSSIRNNALNDIDATTSMQTNRLQDAVDMIKQQNLTDFGYSFEGDSGLADIENAGMVKGADGVWTPNTTTRIGKQIAAHQTATNQQGIENAKAQSTQGTAAVAASGPSKQWFIDTLTQPINVKGERQKIRDLAVKAGYARYTHGKSGAITWL